MIDFVTRREWRHHGPSHVPVIRWIIDVPIRDARLSSGSCVCGRPIVPLHACPRALHTERWQSIVCAILRTPKSMVRSIHTMASTGASTSTGASISGGSASTSTTTFKVNVQKKTLSACADADPKRMNVSSPRALIHRREVGHEAVWSLSTAKPGNGVDQLRDGKLLNRFSAAIKV